jgi:hypothetical protein
MLNSLRAAFAHHLQTHPLRTILVAAFAARLLAVFFAPGYMMHDDHFLTIEPAASWADGTNFNNWLPGIGNSNAHPEPISFFYLGFLYFFFRAFHLFGIENPETQMVLIRLIHAAYSLLTIYFSFKITERISNKKNAIQVGWLLAFIAILPNFSVRNLVELVCMPPLLAGIWLIIRHVPLHAFRLGPLELQAPVINEEKKTPWLMLLLAAFIMGLAVGVRFQTGLFVAMVGGVLLLQHSFLAALLFGLVSFLAFFITQIDDVLLWGGQPFQHLQGYFEYNKKNALNYPGSPLAYLSFISIFILPPVSIFLTIGFFKQWKKLSILVIPTIAFLLFHILYPNKQERFILPALPFFVMAGVVGWNTLLEKRKFGAWHTWSWRIFWSLNTVAMLVLCFTFSKQSRVEAMSYLHDRGDRNNFILEFTHSQTGAMMPQFYSGHWTTYYYFKQGDPVEGILRNAAHEDEITASSLMPRALPNYILFYDDTRLDERVAAMKTHYPTLSFCTTIESGWFDGLLHRLNPKNTLEKIHIYTIGSPAAPVFTN